MDISVYIRQLLYEHDCVIIPGFGGFICNYKPADIHPIHHTIAPPTKAISFNINLRSNDGLLVDFIAKIHQVTFDDAFQIINSWANSASMLLQKGEYVFMSGIGKIHHDIEGNIQFLPDESINYLKASFGLKTLSALPILRGNSIDFTEKFKQETKPQFKGRKHWKVAALLLLLTAMLVLAELMWMGVQIQPLNLNEAGMFGFINNVFEVEEPEIPPLSIQTVEPIIGTNQIDTFSTLSEVEANQINQIPEEVNSNTEESSVPIVANNTLSGNEHTYYVIVGAFAEEKNIELAKERLQQKFPDSVILMQKKNTLTLMGYSVGNQFYKAKEQLLSAQSEDSSYWLMKK
ncbi:MAG: hypothetical protein U0T74_15375 [Chitinophagales bacterium]